MKKIFKLFLATLLVGFASCSFLDIVPEERANDADAFKDPEALKRYMYSCYAYLPDPRNGVNSLDFLTGDEVVTAFEHEEFAHFPKGGYTPSKPRISYWNTLFQGIRQCYILKNNINKVPRLDAKLEADFKAQADFLIGYYHYLLVRCYGPTILIKEEPLIDTDPKDYLSRSSLDEAVEFIVEKLDSSIVQFDRADISKVRLGDEFGLATSIIAKSIKAKLLLYVASPLFNGTSDQQSTLFGKSGYDASNPIADLVPEKYDPQKWVRARDAALEALTAAQTEGHKLYYNGGDHPSSLHPSKDDLTRRTLRFAICDREALVSKSELVWGDARGEGSYGIQKKSIPYWNNGAWNGVAPTDAMLNRFFTKNGLPIEYDNSFDGVNLYSPGSNSDATIGRTPARPGAANTITLVLNREPRFYAWVSFHNGYYEVKGNFTENTADKAKHPYYKDNKAPIGTETLDDAGRLYTEFLADGNCGRGVGTTRRTTNYSLTGFLNKKGVHPDVTASGGAGSPPFYHWPLIRLADLYLMYAEAATECGELDNARQYVDSIRKRAGLPSVELTYSSTFSKKPGWYASKEGMRDIVRRERMVEMYLENQNFWDMRRWLLAGDRFDGKWGERTPGYFNEAHFGCDIDATGLTQFCKKTRTPVIRNFISPTNYLLPIPIEETNKNRKLVQNPGYN